MGGDKGGTRKGRKNEGGGGDIGPGYSQGGTLGRDQQEKKQKSNPLLKKGQVQPGTKAYANKWKYV
jgi:hypothetical protein